MKKRLTGILSIILAILMVAGSLSFAYAATNDVTMVGSGAEDDPWLISNSAQLAVIAEKAGKEDVGFIKIIADIGTGSSTGNNAPVNFTFGGKFTGHLNGGSHKVVMDSTDALITTSEGTIENLVVAGNVNGGIGGCLVVENNGGTIRNCGNTATSTNGAGLCGSNGGTIINCYNTGTVTPTNAKVSGFIGSSGGICKQNDGSIINSYNIANITGHASVGGIAALCYGSITNCYSSGQILLVSPSSGGCDGALCGQALSGSIYKNCYYNKELFSNAFDPSRNYSTVPPGEKVEGLTTAECKGASGTTNALVDKMNTYRAANGSDDWFEWELASNGYPAAPHLFTGDYIMGTGANASKHTRRCLVAGCTAVGAMVDNKPVLNKYVDCDTTGEIVSRAHLKTPADCTHVAVYYKSCACGRSDHTDTFEYGSPLGHGNWMYTVSPDDGTIQASCGREGCTVSTSFTISVSDKVYDGQPAAVTFSGSDGWDDIFSGAPEISYYYRNGDPVDDLKDGKPFLAGEYTAKIELNSANGSSETISLDYTISKKPLTIQVHDCEINADGSEPICTWEYIDYPLLNDRQYLSVQLDTPTWTDTTKPGTYEIRFSVSDALFYVPRVYCYDITVIPGTLTVTCQHVFDREIDTTQYLKSAATCNSPAVYYKSCRCGAFSATESETFERGDTITHSTIQIPQMDATADKDGVKEYYYCGNCRTYFEDASCTKAITDLAAWRTGDGKIEKTDTTHTHSAILVKGQAATCTADGWKDYYGCAGCDKLFSDPACTKAITDLAAWKTGDGKLGKTGHSTIQIPQIDATEDKDGVKAYYYCGNCKKYYADAKCTKEITDLASWKKGDGRIPAIGSEVDPTDPVEPVDPTPSGNRYEACEKPTTGICESYNKYRDVPILNMFFAFIHAILHAIKG